MNDSYENIGSEETRVAVWDWFEIITISLMGFAFGSGLLLGATWGYL